MMRVTFTKRRDPKHFPVWVAHLGKRRIEGSHLGCEADHLGHDIVTLVVEREMGIRDGFFGTVAAGGVFKSMVRRQKPSKRQAIVENRDALAQAEHIVNSHWSRWLKGQATECKDALDRTLEQWLEVEPGGTLTLDFFDLPAHPAKPKRRTERRRSGSRRR